MIVHDAGISISDAMRRLKNGTLGYATKCGGCTACCRTYSQIKGVAIIPETTVCSKVKNSGCKIWHRRPATCKGYSCYTFYMSGVINIKIIENGGKLFSFRVDDNDDIAIVLVLFIIGRTFAEINNGKNVIADDSAGKILSLAQHLIEENDIFSDFKKWSDIDDFRKFKFSGELAEHMKNRNCRIHPKLEELITSWVSGF